tara:strand:+ start:4603 stop:4752 length:150 start_codon:yes stop_codon:yes gene_type:complete
MNAMLSLWKIDHTGTVLRNAGRYGWSQLMIVCASEFSGFKRLFFGIFEV